VVRLISSRELTAVTDGAPRRDSGSAWPNASAESAPAPGRRAVLHLVLRLEVAAGVVVGADRVDDRQAPLAVRRQKRLEARVEREPIVQRDRAVLGGTGLARA
jgi:hypothetical protein